MFLTDLFTFAAQLLLGLSLFGTLAHLLRAQRLMDRVVALEIIAAISVGAIALISMTTGDLTAIDVALAVALVSLTGTVAFAVFMEGRSVDD